MIRCQPETIGELKTRVDDFANHIRYEQQIKMARGALLGRELEAVLRIRSFFSDPVFKIRIKIRIRVTKKIPTKSGSYLDMLLMFSKINIFFVWHFLTKSKHLMTLKIKDKNYLDETLF